MNMCTKSGMRGIQLRDIKMYDDKRAADLRSLSRWGCFIAFADIFWFQLNCFIGSGPLGMPGWKRGKGGPATLAAAVNYAAVCFRWNCFVGVPVGSLKLLLLDDVLRTDKYLCTLSTCDGCFRGLLAQFLRCVIKRFKFRRRFKKNSGR